MKTTAKLLEDSKEVWKEYNVHPFVLGIQNGDLDKEKFRFYILQDYIYLKEYAKAFALGVAKAKSLETAEMFAKYIQVMHGEMNIHNGYFGTFGVSQAELDAERPSLDNLSYTSYMLRVAYEEGEAEILAAILSCAYSYEVIAKQMLKNNPDADKHPFYGAWVSGYASKEYSEENKLLIEALDRLTLNYSEEQIRHLSDIFLMCSRYELAFWEMAWNIKR